MGLLPAKVIGADASDALLSLLGCRYAHGVGHRKHRGVDVLWHDMVAHRHAAGHLNVDNLVQSGWGLVGCGCAMRHQLRRHIQPLLARHRIGDAHLLKAALQPCHMLRKAKWPTQVHRHYLVDAVPKDESTIHHADLCVAQRSELAIEVARSCGKLVHWLIVAAATGRLVPDPALLARRARNMLSSGQTGKILVYNRMLC